MRWGKGGGGAREGGEGGAREGEKEVHNHITSVRS